MPNISLEDFNKCFNKHLLEALVIIAEKEKAGIFTLPMSGEVSNAGKVSKSQYWQINPLKGRVETASYSLKPGSKSSDSIEELLNPNNISVNLIMTCQMSVQLAYYGALLKTFKDLSPMDLSLFDKTFPADSFILRDFDPSAGAAFMPSVNHIACKEADGYKISLHPMVPFILWSNLSSSSLLAQRHYAVGEHLTLNNFPGYEIMSGINNSLGNPTFPSRRVMVICSSAGDIATARFTTFGYAGEHRDVDAIAEGLVKHRNQLSSDLRRAGFAEYADEERTKEELLQSPTFGTVNLSHKHLDLQLLTSLVNAPERVLESLTALRKSMSEEVAFLQDLERQGDEFPERNWKILGDLASAFLKRGKPQDAIKRYLELLYRKDKEILSIIKSQGSGNKFIEGIKYEISCHYNLGRCYEELANNAAAATHFRMCTHLAKVYNRPIDPKHQQHLNDAYSKAYPSQTPSLNFGAMQIS